VGHLAKDLDLAVSGVDSDAVRCEVKRVLHAFFPFLLNKNLATPERGAVTVPETPGGDRARASQDQPSGQTA
jgi:hypothetical protein